MNKTEPVRRRDQVRDFRSCRVPKSDTVGLANSGSYAATTSTATGMGYYQTLELANSRTSELLNSATPELSKVVSS